MQANRKTNRALAVELSVLLLLTVCLRSICFIVSTADPAVRQTEEDSAAFLTLASNLASGRGFGRVRAIPPGVPAEWHPEINRTPGYPVVIAAGQLATGNGQTSTILFQHALGILLCLTASLVCRHLFGRKAGLLAGCLLALDLQGIALNNKILTASIFGFCLFGAAVAIARVAHKPRAANALLAGILLGLCTLVRPTSIALASLVAVAFLIRGLIRHQRKAVLAAVLLGFSGNAIIGGWVARNGLVSGEYTFSTIARYNLLYYHAGAALARGEGVSRQASIDKLSNALDTHRLCVSYMPLSSTENAEVRELAFKTMWKYKSAFIKGSLILTANTLFGPEKHILSVLGLPWVRFGILQEKASFGRASSVSWSLLGVQVVFLGIVYTFVLRTLLQRLKGKRFPTLVWICLGFAIYVLILSSGSPGDPRLRWPVIPLLVVAGVASLGRRGQAGVKHLCVGAIS